MNPVWQNNNFTAIFKISTTCRLKLREIKKKLNKYKSAIEAEANICYENQKNPK